MGGAAGSSRDRLSSSSCAEGRSCFIDSRAEEQGTSRRADAGRLGQGANAKKKKVLLIAGAVRQERARRLLDDPGDRRALVELLDRLHIALGDGIEHGRAG